jgi:hypothetical protein
MWVNQLQLTIADFVTEIHDTHHPISGALYYHQQKAEARRRTKYFRTGRMPKFLGYFEQVLSGAGKRRRYMAGNALSYADLSLFQIVAGLRYAFPKTMKRLEPDYPGLVELHGRIAARPNIAAYLASKRRIPFNQDGIFRHYPELDGLVFRYLPDCRVAILSAITVSGGFDTICAEFDRDFPQHMVVKIKLCVYHLKTFMLRIDDLSASPRALHRDDRSVGPWFPSLNQGLFLFGS